MAWKWIFSCFIILGILKSIKTNELIKNSTTSEEQKQLPSPSPSSSSTEVYENQKQDQNQDKNKDMNQNSLEMVSESKQNLTAITWAHAVNSQDQLNTALQSDVQMIEADIVLGKLINGTDDNLIPIMAHPPNNESDISLDNFLNQILKHNNNNEVKDKKGVKLDFKSTEVFEGSVDLLKSLWPLMTYPIWINADIIKGPVNATTTKPVDPKRFFNGCKHFNTATLSIGWTTRWGSDFLEGSYTENNINEMLDAIKINEIITTKHKITFPVRAGIAANSQSQLHNLVNDLNGTNEVTLTIWSSPNDFVDIEKLRNLIFSFGFDRIYLDVPNEVSSKLNLNVPPSLSTTDGTVGISSFASFGIISACLVAISYLREIQF